MEICNYTGYESNNCFRSETSPGAYRILLGHTKMFAELPILAPFEPEHQFIQYRGLTYEFSYDGIVVHDVNDPLYNFGENNLNWKYASRGLEDVGISYCEFTDIKFYFLEHWELYCYMKFTKNCIHFAQALQLFLTTGPCEAPMKTNEGLMYTYKMDKHGGYIVRNSPDTLKIFGRSWWWSSFLIQSVDTRIIITTLLVLYCCI